MRARRGISACLGALSCFASASALACSPPIPGELRPPPPTIEQQAEAIVRGSDTIVYGLLTRGTEDLRDGRLRIIHVYKGTLRPGTTIAIKASWGFDPPPCAGMLGSPPPRSKGTYGVFAWSGEPVLDQVSEEWLAMMFDHGWLTPASKRRKPRVIKRHPATG